MGPPSILVIDHNLADLLQAVLTDEGYTVSVLYDVAADGLRTAVG